MKTHHNLIMENWQKLHTERDPWRVLAIGSEATAWWVYVRSHPHSAAETVMSTHELCRRLDTTIANLWLRSLVSTSLWTSLLTQDFFLSWLGRTAPELLPVEKDLGEENQNGHETAPINSPTLDNFGVEAQSTSVDAKSAATFRQRCAIVLDDLHRWEVQAGRLERNVGGFNALQALNMSRWMSRGEVTEASSIIYNAAAFGLEFLPHSAERYEGSLLQEVLDGRVELHSVTLGTYPNRE